MTEPNNKDRYTSGPDLSQGGGEGLQKVREAAKIIVMAFLSLIGIMGLYGLRDYCLLHLNLYPETAQTCIQLTNIFITCVVFMLILLTVGKQGIVKILESLIELAN